MYYCKECLYPSTKPDLWFRDGICGACHNFREFRAQHRYRDGKEFKDFVLSRKKNKHYDCIVPVSGGKDSTYQVLKVLEMGLVPLCVTAPTDFLTPLGRRNIENLKQLGVDYLEISVNPKIRKLINRFAFDKVGDLQWPEHVLIFTAPVIVAVNMNIPTLIWGECQMREYGAGPEEAASQLEFSRNVMEEFGGFNGLRVSDLLTIQGISDKDLYWYTYPSNEEIQRVGVAGIYLDYFFPWSGIANSIIAQAHGFEQHHDFVEGTIAPYENLDNYVHGIHDYFKYLKFGFGRATDVACNYIRRGVLDRGQAAQLVSLHDGKYPATYLGKPLPEILQHFDISMRQFEEKCDAYINEDIFQFDSSDHLVLRQDGSPKLNVSFNKTHDD